MNTFLLRLLEFFLLASFVSVRAGAAETPAVAPQQFLRGEFKWAATAPLVSPAQRPDDPCYSVKDPTIVRHGDRWHLFTTIRSQKRSHQIEYLSFDDWPLANAAQRHILTITNGYFCAPQVFYFIPHKRWYLVYQISDSTLKMLQPAFSTSTNISDPVSWTPPRPLYQTHPTNITAWIDFWIICDDAKAHLFFTSNNGLMWRTETRLVDFPHGWNAPKVVLRGDIFEASHTYRLKGLDQFLTIIEAQAAGGRRYYKAYLADRLDGEWKPCAATKEKPFADLVNVRDSAAHWSDSISHGELLRTGHDEKMEVDPANLKFLFQGVSEARRAGKKYGEIPWELGLLEQAP
jgi:hypothetical protein